MGTSKNALFPRLRRQLRARFLMYPMYTAVLRAVLPCTHKKITIFRGAHIIKKPSIQIYISNIDNQVEPGCTQMESDIW